MVETAEQLGQVGTAVTDHHETTFDSVIWDDFKDHPAVPVLSL